MPSLVSTSVPSRFLAKGCKIRIQKGYNEPRTLPLTLLAYKSTERIGASFLASPERDPSSNDGAADFAFLLLFLLPGVWTCGLSAYPCRRRSRPPGTHPDTPGIAWTMGWWSVKSWTSSGFAI
jgi:hypothetical protein